MKEKDYRIIYKTKDNWSQLMFLKLKTKHLYHDSVSFIVGITSPFFFQQKPSLLFSNIHYSPTWLNATQKILIKPNF